jgi:hypothetical protein
MSGKVKSYANLDYRTVQKKEIEFPHWRRYAALILCLAYLCQIVFVIVLSHDTILKS